MRRDEERTKKTAKILLFDRARAIFGTQMILKQNFESTRKELHTNDQGKASDFNREKSQIFYLQLVKGRNKQEAP